jgi:hypothetical protein
MSGSCWDGFVVNARSYMPRVSVGRDGGNPDWGINTPSHVASVRESVGDSGNA